MSADVSARSVSRAPGVDRVRALQRVPYRCAKQAEDRRFHALYDKVVRSDRFNYAWATRLAVHRLSGTVRPTLAFASGERCR